MNRKKFIKNSIGIVGASFYGTLMSCSKEETVTPDNGCVTKSDDEGPFFKLASTNNTDLTQLGPGDSALYSNQKVKIKVSGTVFSGDNCDVPVADATIHIWHADPDGHYDVKESSPGAGDAIPDNQVQIVFRTVLTTNANGEYSFVTYQPFGYYNRPQHIHFKVQASDHRELITQLYFNGDPKLVPGNFADGISQAEADAIDEDRKLMLTTSSSQDFDLEGTFNLKLLKS